MHLRSVRAKARNSSSGAVGIGRGAARSFFVSNSAGILITSFRATASIAPQSSAPIGERAEPVSVNYRFSEQPGSANSRAKRAEGRR